MGVTIGGISLTRLTAHPAGWQGADVLLGAVARCWEVEGICLAVESQGLWTLFSNWRESRLADGGSGVGSTVSFSTDRAGGGSVTNLPVWFTKAPQVDIEGNQFTVRFAVIDAAQAVAAGLDVRGGGSSGGGAAVDRPPGPLTSCNCNKLMELLQLRSTLEYALADLLGTYTYPGGATSPAFSVRTDGSDLPAGLQVTGLEVVLDATPRPLVVQATYTAGQSAVLQGYSLALYQWSGLNLRPAQYRVAQLWPGAKFKADPPSGRVPSATVDLPTLGPLGIGGTMPTEPAPPSYAYDQPTPAAAWTIDHNLGVYPTVEVYDWDWNTIEGAIAHPSLTQTVITFSVPVAGHARLK